MADRRIKLHAQLVEILPNVYFNPPESVKLRYPCIVYNRSDVDIDFADDMAYKPIVRYSLTIIDLNPDSTYYMKVIEKFAGCNYVQHFNKEGLSHDVIELYY